MSKHAVEKLASGGPAVTDGEESLEVDSVVISEPKNVVETDTAANNSGEVKPKPTQTFSGRKYIVNVVAMLIQTWMTWVPSCSIIYALPVALQLILFNAIIFVFSIVLSTAQAVSVA